jgi:hypothetical protein
MGDNHVGSFTGRMNLVVNSLSMSCLIIVA